MNGQLLKLWAGTQDELTAIKDTGKIEPGTLYYIKDTQSFAVGVTGETNELQDIWVKDLTYSTTDEEGKSIRKTLSYDYIKDLHEQIIKDIMPNIPSENSGDYVVLARKNGDTLDFIAQGALSIEQGGTGKSRDSFEALSNDIIKSVNDPAAISKFFNNSGEGIAKLNYIDTANIDNNAIKFQNLTSDSFVEGVTYKIKLNGDLPTNACFQFKNASNDDSPKYIILNSQYQPTRGGEIMANGYLELVCSKTQYEGYSGIGFFKSGGTNGGRPRKLKGSVSFTEDTIFCPADYGLQVGDKITVTLVDSGATLKNHIDQNDKLFVTKLDNNFVDKTTLKTISNSLSSSSTYGIGGYIPNFPGDYGKTLLTSDYKALGSYYIRNEDNLFNTAGLSVKNNDYYTYDYNRKILLNLQDNVITKAGNTSYGEIGDSLGYGSSQTFTAWSSSSIDDYQKTFKLIKQQGVINNSNMIFIQVGYGSDNAELLDSTYSKYQSNINIFDLSIPFIAYNNGVLNYNNDFKKGQAIFKYNNKKLDFAKILETACPYDIIHSQSDNRVWIRATYSNGSFLDSQGYLWVNGKAIKTGLPSLYTGTSSDAYLESSLKQLQPYAYYIQDQNKFYWINAEYGYNSNKATDTIEVYGASIQILSNNIIESISKINYKNLATNETGIIDFQLEGNQIQLLSSFSDDSLVIKLKNNNCYIYSNKLNGQWEWYQVNTGSEIISIRHCLRGVRWAINNTSREGYDYTITNNQVSINTTSEHRSCAGFYYQLNKGYITMTEEEYREGYFDFYLNQSQDKNQNGYTVIPRWLGFDHENNVVMTILNGYGVLHQGPGTYGKFAPGYCEISWDIDET